MSSCAELAANLTSNYLSTAWYNGVSPLVDFLTVTGVLLSVCLGTNCTANDFDGMDSGSTHLSGSWIQASTTGPRLFGGIGIPSDDNQGQVMGGIGMILDPREVEIDCLFPLDAITDGRGKNGCGSMMSGGYQLPWFQRQQMKLYYYWKKLRHFRTTKWEDIPCSKMLSWDDNDPDDNQEGLNAVIGITDHQEHWATNMQFIQKMAESVMGHTVCYDDSTPEFPDQMWMVAYVGDEAWEPSDWNNNTAVTQDIIDQFPKDATGIWNEIVMKNLDSLEDYERVVQAIFYVDSPCDQGQYFRKQAYEQAKTLGDKPVLEFNPQVQEDQVLFRCPSEAAQDAGRGQVGCGPSAADRLKEQHQEIMDAMAGKASHKEQTFSSRHHLRMETEDDDEVSKATNVI